MRHARYKRTLWTAFLALTIIVSSCLYDAPLTVRAGEAEAEAEAEVGAEAGSEEPKGTGVPGESDDTEEPDGAKGTGDAEKSEEPDGAEETDDAEESEEPEDSEALTYTDKQGVVYTITGSKKCYVSGYTDGIKSSVSIPETIKTGGITYTVKGIKASALKNCTALKELQIPNSITSIAKNVFTGCKKLKTIVILPVKSAMKTSGKTSVVTVKIDSALLSTSADVKLEIDAGVVKQAAADTKTNAVTLQVFVRDNSGYQVGDLLPGDIVLLQKAVKTIVNSKKSFKVRVKDALSGSYYIKADTADLKNLSGNLPLTVQKKEVADTSGTVKTDLKKALKKNGIDAGDVEILSYSFEQDSRTNINIVFPAQGVKGAKAGSELYVYRYDKSNQVFAAISFHSYTVSKLGNITMPISKGGTFVVTKTPFQYMSRQPASEFLTEAGSTYYVDKNGNPVRGWMKLGSDYYYFDRESGKMAANTTVDSVKLSADGTAKQTAAGVARIQTMMKARAIVEKVTKSTDTKSQKIEKCFRWVFQFPYRRYRRLMPIYKQAGWEVTFANDIFDHQQGCCVSEACAVAFMFHECGYETVYVGTDTGHAWVELNGRVYDPLFAEARGFSQYYNIPYSSYYMSKPVLKRKI